MSEVERRPESEPAVEGPRSESLRAIEAERGVVPAIVRYLDSRIGLESLLSFLRAKEFPVHKHSFWYYWGGATLFFFLIQLFTGFLLLVYYRPTEPHESVQAIVSQVEFGWLMRSVHSWSANLMVASAFVHMFSVFFMRSYHRLRDLGWYSGIVLLMLVFGLGFTGYALPGDEVAYFATKIGIRRLGGDARAGRADREHPAWRPGHHVDHDAAAVRAARRRSTRAVHARPVFAPFHGAAARHPRAG